MYNKKLFILLFTVMLLLLSRQQCYAATQSDIPQESSNVAQVTLESTSTSESLQVGSTGSKVVTIQCKLEMTNDTTGKPYFKLPPGADYGNYGEVTKTAVKKFQADKSLPTNGVVDISDNPESTWKKMDLGKDEFILAKGSNDINVVQLQQWLQSLDYLKVVASGVFDTVTETAVNDYKDKNGLLNSEVYRGKVGYTTLTKFVKKQILKDAYLLEEEIKGAEWHFFRSAITGKIGASKPLLDFLTQNGIKYFIHQ